MPARDQHSGVGTYRIPKLIHGIVVAVNNSNGDTGYDSDDGRSGDC